MSDNPIDFFKQVIQHIHPKMGAKAVDFFVEGASIRTIKKKELFIKTARPHREIGFVAQGLFRGFYVDRKQQQITTRLIKEGNFATHYRAFLTQQPSKYNFQALEDSVLVCFTYDHVQKGYEQFPEIERFGRLVAEEILKILELRIESFQFQTAEERYLSFMENNPAIFSRITVDHLASYLGIQRPSLSRIRKKLSQPIS